MTAPVCSAATSLHSLQLGGSGGVAYMDLQEMLNNDTVQADTLTIGESFHSVT